MPLVVRDNTWTVVSYQIRLTTQAESQLEHLPNDVQQRITDTLVTVSQTRKPTDHEKATQRKGNGLLKVRVGAYRAICNLNKPHLDVLRVAERSRAYRNIEELSQRVG